MVLKKAKSLAVFAAMLISSVSASHAMLTEHDLLKDEHDQIMRQVRQKHNVGFSEQELHDITYYNDLLKMRTKKEYHIKGTKKEINYLNKEIIDSNTYLSYLQKNFLADYAQTQERMESFREDYEKSKSISSNMISAEMHARMQIFQSVYEHLERSVLCQSELAAKQIISLKTREQEIKQKIIEKRIEIENSKKGLNKTKTSIQKLESVVPNIQQLHHLYISRSENTELQEIRIHRDYDVQKIANRIERMLKTEQKLAVRKRQVRLYQARKRKEEAAAQKLLEQIEAMQKAPLVEQKCLNQRQMDVATTKQQSAAKKRRERKGISSSGPISERSTRVYEHQRSSAASSVSSDGE